MIKKGLVLGLLLAVMLIAAIWAGEDKQGKAKNSNPEPPALSNDQKITPELKSKIEGLIKKLGDNDWNIREKAQEQLLIIGKPIIYPVIDSIESVQDKEIKTRCIVILTRLDAELSDDETASLEKRIAESKSSDKEILRKASVKWLGTEANGLKFTIKADKKILSLKNKEPLTIEFKFVNTGKEDFYVCKRLVYHYAVNGTGAVKEENRRVEIDYTALSKDEFVLLKPGDVYTRTTASRIDEKKKAITLFEGVFYYYSWWSLAKPGKYQIAVQAELNGDGKQFGLKGWIGGILSNTVAVEIKDEDK